MQIGFRRPPEKLDASLPATLEPKAPPEPQSTVMQVIRELIASGRPFEAEIIVAGDFEKISVKEANPCETTHE